MAAKGVHAADQEEQDKIDSGIKLWLLENGIRETDKDEYRKQYIIKALDKINAADLKTYMMVYPIISEVIQIVFEYKEDGKISSERKRDFSLLEKNNFVRFVYLPFYSKKNKEKK